MVESEKPKAKTEKHLPWIEKYRPVEFNQIVGKSDFLFSIRTEAYTGVGKGAQPRPPPSYDQ